MILYGSIAFPFNRDAVAGDFRRSALAGAQDNVDVIVFGFGQIAFVELLFVSYFNDFEAFGYHEGGELPELFKQSV